MKNLKKESNLGEMSITRKQAIKKLGRYAGLTALGTFMILSPKKAQAQSPNPPVPGGFGF
jgi:hypothetical protein